MIASIKKTVHKLDVVHKLSAVHVIPLANSLAKGGIKKVINALAAKYVSKANYVFLKDAIV